MTTDTTVTVAADTGGLGPITGSHTEEITGDGGDITGSGTRGHDTAGLGHTAQRPPAASL